MVGCYSFLLCFPQDIMYNIIPSSIFEAFISHFKAKLYLDPFKSKINTIHIIFIDC